MRHGKSGKTLGMSTAQRVAALRSMTTALIKYGRIETTLQRAKALRVFIEPLITKGKFDENAEAAAKVAARRYLMSKIHSKDAVKRLVDKVSVTFKERKGGYTRIVRTGFRKGDNAKLAIIEFVDKVEE